MSKNCSDNHTRPTIAQALFPNMDSDKLWYWSSSHYAAHASRFGGVDFVVGGDNTAWGVDFLNGGAGSYYRHVASYVRLVR